MAHRNALLELRDYQKTVVKEALKTNTLAVLPTGSGKTLIAACIISTRLKQIRERSSDDLTKKLIAFLAPTKILVGQQHRYLTTHITVEDTKIIPFTGETIMIDGKSIQSLNQNGWDEQLKETDVLVMTPQIFKQMLQKKLFQIDYFDCIVIDECHHASGDHPLTHICETVKLSLNPPLMFAMTASPVMCKKAAIHESLASLENMLGCKILCTQEILDQYKSLTPNAELSVFRYSCDDREDFVHSYTVGSSLPHASCTSKCIDLKADYTKLMLLAFQRSRFASLTNTLYTLLVNMRTEATELGIQDEGYPTVEVFQQYRKTGALDPTVAFRLNPMKHTLKYNGKIKFGGGSGAQLVQSFGQVLKICEDSGTVAGLYAFLVSLGNTKRSMTFNATKFTHSSLQKNEVGFRIKGRGGNRRRFVPRIELSSTGGISDLDRIDSIAKDLQSSPFRIIDLIHENYCFCVSLFDFMIGFASSLGPMVCFHAQRKFLQLQKRPTTANPSPFICRVKVNTNAAIDIASEGEEHLNLYITQTIIYILLECVINGKVLNPFNVEGCLALVAEHWSEYVIVEDEKQLEEAEEEAEKEIGSPSLHLSDYELREKDCYNSLLCIGWCLLCNISVEELSEWSSTLEDNETSACLEPLRIDEMMNDDSEMILDFIDDLPCKSELQSFVPISVKLQALCKVWLLLNSTIDPKADEEIPPLYDSILSTSTDTSNTNSPESVALLSNKGEDSDVAQIVFCRMRLNAVALHFVVSTIVENLTESTAEPTNEDEITFFQVKVLVTDMLDAICGERRSKLKWSCRESSIRSPKFRSAHMVGGSSQERQLEVLKLFKGGNFNIVFATDVMEEGLDVRACKYVINFDLPSCVKSFVQRKGRSRSENSQMIFLIPTGKDGSKIIRELIELQDQEKQIEKYANQPKHDSTAPMEVFSIFEQTTVYCEAEYAFIDKTNDLLKFEGSFDLFTDFISSSVSKDANLHRLYNIVPVMDRYTVQSTGAEVDSKTATQLLQRFCHKLPHDSFYRPQPIYWITKRMEGTTIEYSCSILLPPHVEPGIRFIVGPYVSSKTLAKGYASLECVKLLHDNGDLNDHLMIVGGRRRSVENGGVTRGGVSKRRKLSHMIGGGKELRSKDTEEDQLIENMQADDDFKLNEDNKELIKISSKYVPDLLCDQPNMSSEKETTMLYFYVVQTTFADEKSKEIVMNCMSCRYYFQGLNSFGIALPSFVPEEILLETFSGFIREYESVDIAFQFLDCREVTTDELIQMQRFHKAIICWESENITLGDEKQGYNWLDETQSLRDQLWPTHGATYPIPEDEWRQSANGAYYIVYPLPEFPHLKDELTDLPCVEKAMKYVENLKNCSIYQNKVEWIDHLLHAADQAQILAHNLMVQHKINQGPNACYFTPYKDTVNRDLEGMLLSRGFGTIYVCCSCKKEKRLNDIAKYVPKEQLVAEIKPTVKAVVTDIASSIDASSTNIEAKMNYQKLQDRSTIPAMPSSNNATAPLRKAANTTDSDMTPISFIQIFMRKHPKYIPQLALLGQKSDHYLISVVGIAAKLTLLCLLKSPFLGVNEGLTIQQVRRRPHTHATRIHVLPELSQAIGKCKWYAVGLVAPAIAWRLQSLILSFEVRDRILKSIIAYDRRNVKCEDEFQIKDTAITHSAAEATKLDGISGEVQADKLNLPFSIPNVSIMLEAITPRSIIELIDSERLELLGDSLLKLVTTVEVYRLFPRKHEGFLTFERAKFISNIFLLERACKLGLHHYLRAVPISSGKQQLITMPPGIDLDKFKEGKCLWNSILTPSKAAEREEEEALMKIKSSSFRDMYPVKQHKYVEVKPKTLADLMEAIFGAFYVSGGLAAGIAVIKAFGVWPTLKKPTSLPSVPSSSTAAAGGMKENKEIHQTETEMMMIEDPLEPSLVPIGNVELTDQSPPDYHFQRIEFTNFLEEFEFPENYPEVLKRIVRGMKRNVTELQRDEAEGEAAPAEINLLEDEAADLFDMNEAMKINESRTLTEINKASVKSFGILHLSSEQVVNEIERIYNYRFKNWKILEEALTHCSCQEATSNQRLEFLGDAVLDFAVVTLLYEQQPNATPGDLSSQKSELTCNRHLGLLGIKMGIYKYLKFFSTRLEADFEELLQTEDPSTLPQPAPERTSEELSVASDAMEIEELDEEGNVIKRDDVESAGDILCKETKRPFSLLETVQVDVEGDLEVEELMKACISEMITYIEDQEKPIPPSIIQDSAPLLPILTPTKKKSSARINYSTSKVVADMFEALIGAIFLDCDCCFDKAVHVVQHLNLLSSLSQDSSNRPVVSFINDEETPVAVPKEDTVGKKRGREDKTKKSEASKEGNTINGNGNSNRSRPKSFSGSTKVAPATAKVCSHTVNEGSQSKDDRVIGVKRKLSFEEQEKS